MATLRKTELAILVLLVLILLRLQWQDQRQTNELILSKLSKLTDVAQHEVERRQVQIPPSGVPQSTRETCHELFFSHQREPADYTATLVWEGKAYESSPKFKNKIAEMLGQKRWRGPAQERALRRLVTPGSSVLDLGCASGTITRKAKARAGIGRVDGVELVPGWVAAARESIDGVTFHEGDMTAVDLHNATFDTILMNDSLEHVPVYRYRPLWNVLASHSSDGGNLYIHIPTPQKQLRTRRKMKGEHGGGEGSWAGGDTKEQFFEEVVCYPQLMRQAACYGFSLVTMHTDEIDDKGYASLYFKHVGQRDAPTCTELKPYANLAAEIRECAVLECGL